MLVIKIATVVQTVLYCQPDAKIANGMFWAEFWMKLLWSIVS